MKGQDPSVTTKKTRTDERTETTTSGCRRDGRRCRQLPGRCSLPSERSTSATCKRGRERAGPTFVCERLVDGGDDDLELGELVLNGSESLLGGEDREKLDLFDRESPVEDHGDLREKEGELSERKTRIERTM